MNADTQNGTAKSWLWLAGAVGAAAGLATLAYSRRPRSRWDRMRQTVLDSTSAATKQVKPWMSATAGAAAGCAALAYRRAQKPATWRNALRQAGKMYPVMRKLMA